MDLWQQSITTVSRSYRNNLQSHIHIQIVLQPVSTSLQSSLQPPKYDEKCHSNRITWCRQTAELSCVLQVISALWTFVVGEHKCLLKKRQQRLECCTQTEQQRPLLQNPELPLWALTSPGNLLLVFREFKHTLQSHFTKSETFLTKSTESILKSIQLIQHVHIFFNTAVNIHMTAERAPCWLTLNGSKCNKSCKK